MADEVKIRISATNDTKAASDAAANDISKVGKAADEANKTGSESTSSLKANWAMMVLGINQGVQIAQAAIEAFKKVIDFTVQGAAIERLQDSSQMLAQSMGLDMDDIVEAVRKASLGTVADMDIMASANKAMMLGVGSSAEEMARLMEVAAIRGRAMGLSTTQAFSDIVTGIGRQSKMILDNLDIVLNLDQVYGDYAETLGKTALQLTDVEKKQAMVNAVIESTQGLLEETGGLLEDHLVRWEQGVAAQKNYWDEVKKSTSGVGAWFGEVNKNIFGKGLLVVQFQDLIKQAKELGIEVAGIGKGAFAGNQVVNIDEAAKAIQRLRDEIALAEGGYSSTQIALQDYYDNIMSAADGTNALAATLSELEAEYSSVAGTIRNDLIGAINDLASAEEGWRASVGGDIASTFQKLAEEAGLSTDEMIERLGLVDEAFGTNKAYEFELNMKTDELAALLLADPEAFMAQSAQFEDYFMPLDTAVAESQALVDELQTKLTNIERIYIAKIRIVYEQFGGSGGVPGADMNYEDYTGPAYNSVPFEGGGANNARGQAPINVTINTPMNFADVAWAERELAPLFRNAIQQAERGR